MNLLRDQSSNQNSSSRDVNTSDDDGVPEPVPDWSKPKAQVVWKWALPAHSYSLGIIFLLVALYAMFVLYRLTKTCMKKSRNYLLCMTLLICVFGFTRATVLVVDPYTTQRTLTFSPSFGLLLFSLGFPCLTSGFFLINWSLIEVTKLQLLPSRIHQRPVLVGVVLVHFTVVISLDVSFSFFPKINTLIFICRSFFVFWGILLFGGFLACSLRIKYRVKHNIRNLRINTGTSNLGAIPPECRVAPTIAAATFTTTTTTKNIKTKLHNAWKQNKIQQTRTRRVMKIAGRAATAGLLICSAQVYALWEFYRFHHDNIKPEAWPWWVYQTCFRLIELFMVIQMFSIVRPWK